MSIGSEGVESISKGLKKNKVLRILSLSMVKFKVENNNLSAEAIRFISDALWFNKTLVSLNLDNNEFGGKGVNYIRTALTKNKSLIDLSLSIVESKGKETILLE